MENVKFKVPPKEVQEKIIERIISRVETRTKSFTREDFMEFGKEAKIPAVYADQVSEAVIEDLSLRVFSRLLVNGLIIPVKGTKYYRKITQEEMDAAKKAYLEAQAQEEENYDDTLLN